MFGGIIKIIKQFGYDLFYENGSLSLAKMTACWGYFVYTWTSIYLMVTGQTWGHYTEFSTYMAGTSTLILTGNKFINSKYNTVQGGFGTNDGTTDNGRPQIGPPISPEMSGRLDKLDETVSRSSEMYGEYAEKAQQLSHTIDTAKETAERLQEGMSSISSNISIRDGINLASLAKSAKKK